MPYVYHRRLDGKTVAELKDIIWKLEKRLAKNTEAHRVERNRLVEESAHWFDMYQGQISINNRLRKVQTQEKAA